MNTAIKIKELRESCGMNRSEFSKFTGIPVRTLEDWEAARRTPPDYVPRLLEYQIRYEKTKGRSGDTSDSETAYLSNENDLISFKFRNKEIRFRGPYSLDHFDKIISWDKGYLVVEASYAHSESPVEDYIDLIPILNDLYIDTESFLNAIKKVEVCYA